MADGDPCGEREIWTLGTHLRGLGLLVSGKESVGDGALPLTYLLGFAPVEYGGRGQSNLESTADTEDTVIGLLGGKTLDGLLDILALLRDQVIEPNCEVSKCFCPTLPRTISERPGLQANSTQPRSHSKDVPPVRDEFDQAIPKHCLNRSWSGGYRYRRARIT